jgi:hypothetical protein
MDKLTSVQFDIGQFYEKLWHNFCFHLDLATLRATLHKSIYFNLFQILASKKLRKRILRIWINMKNKLHARILVEFHKQPVQYC